MYKFFISIFLFMISSSVLANDTDFLKTLNSAKNYAYDCDGYEQLKEHSFIIALQERNYSLKQLAQYFRDKEFIFKSIEKILIAKELISYDSSHFRSNAYNNEFKTLISLFQNQEDLRIIQPSSAAIRYCDYLDGLTTESLDRALIHAWLYSLAETTSGQELSNHISQFNSSLGIEIRDYRAMSIADVKSEINTWLSHVEDLTNWDLKSEINKSYQYSHSIFDKIVEIKEDPSFLDSVSSFFKSLSDPFTKKVK